MPSAARPRRTGGDACVDLVADAGKRANLARGFEIFSRRGETAILRKALGMDRPEPRNEFPGILNLGSGKDWRDNCLNLDISEIARPDALFDVAAPLESNTLLQTTRFGQIRLEENVFDAIVANDVPEHIPDLVKAMSNCLQLLKPGGTFHIHVPYDLSLGAWQDPTHVRAFNENSWLYYTDWRYGYFGWTEARFEQLSLEFHLSESGKQMSADGRALEELLRTPRAVDGMSVVLRKRYLLESEIARSSEEQGSSMRYHPTGAEDL